MVCSLDVLERNGIKIYKETLMLESAAQSDRSWENISYFIFLEQRGNETVECTWCVLVQIV